ncbi:MAG: transposase [Thermoplasmatales archaeon]
MYSSACLWTPPYLPLTIYILFYNCLNNKGNTSQIDAPYESKKCAGSIRNLLKRKRDDLFRFVINRDIESTNNRAERAIRPIVTYRKVSGGSRSDLSARDFARV